MGTKFAESSKMITFDKNLPINWYRVVDIKELGQLIHQRRMVLDLSLRDLSELTGISKTTISQIERGERNPTYEVLMNIFEYLNLECKVDVRKRK